MDGRSPSGLHVHRGSSHRAHSPSEPGRSSQPHSPRDWNPPGLGFICNTRLPDSPRKRGEREREKERSAGRADGSVGNRMRVWKTETPPQSSDVPPEKSRDALTYRGTSCLSTSIFSPSTWGKKYSRYSCIHPPIKYLWNECKVSRMEGSWLYHQSTPGLLGIPAQLRTGPDVTALGCALFSLHTFLHELAEGMAATQIYRV